MRAILLALLLLTFAACDSRSREERALERAQRDLEEARQELAEARERADDNVDEARDRVRDARERVRDLGGRTDDTFREDMEALGEDLERAFDEANLDEKIERALDGIGEALNPDPDVQPVTFRKLRDLLPDEIDGMEQEFVEGENAGALGIRVSHVKARYDGVGREVMLSLVDLGTLHRAAEAGLDWLDAHVDRETPDGYERSTEIAGHPAHVRVRERTARSDIEATVLVSGRFVIHIEAKGRDIDLSLVESIVEDLGRLEDLG